MISSYKIDGNKILISAPYSQNVVETCRKWGGKYSNGAWAVAITRLPEVQARLGINLEDEVEVEVGENTEPDGSLATGFEGYQQLRIGWYILAGRRSRDYSADIYADLVAGEIPSSGGSVKSPAVNPSSNARFRLWVARDFAVARKLQIVTDPKANEPEPEPANPLAEFTVEQLQTELARRGVPV
jgi:hypothetical protein